MAILGVDLGTSNSRGAVWKDGKSVPVPNRYGALLTPSVIGLGEECGFLVGKPAWERLISNPDRTASNFRRFLGSGRKVSLGGQKFSPEELYAILLCGLREDGEEFLGEEISEAVLSVPAGFDASERGALRTACALAGLRSVRLISRPVAAALTAYLPGEMPDRSILVFDFGGTSLDISVVDCFENQMTILAHQRDTTLGGEAFDRAIAAYFCSRNEILFEALPPGKQALLLRQAEQCKMALSKLEALLMLQEESGLAGVAPLSNQTLINLTGPIFRRIDALLYRTLGEGDLTFDEVDEVILVGGSCRMTVVREFLSRYFLPHRLHMQASETIVARGLAAYPVLTKKLQGQGGLFFSDISPFTLSTSCRNEAEPKRPLASPIIERGTPLPATRIRRFHTLHDRQPELVVDVYRGESLYCEDNERMGELRIQLPLSPAEQEVVEVRFTYDIDGILEIEATVESTGLIRRWVLKDQKNGLKEEETEGCLKAFSALKRPPWELEENSLVLARGERLYTETLGDVRAELMDAVEWFRAVLNLAETYQIARARKLVTSFFDHVERQLFDLTS